MPVVPVLSVIPLTLMRSTDLVNIPSSSVLVSALLKIIASAKVDPVGKDEEL